MANNNSEYMRLDNLPDLECPWVAMMVGTPGSGKSTIAEQVGALMGVPVYSADKMRESLTGDASDQSVNAAAWEMVYDEAARQLEAGCNVIVDGTHANPEWRKRDAKRYGDMGARAVVAIYVELPLETTHVRNRNRERIVPPAAIERIHNAITTSPPTLAEGFDGVIRINNE